MVLPILMLDAPHARAAMRVEVAQAVAGKPFLAAVEVDADPRWHVYWRNPGDSGIPTTIEWTAPKGWRVEPLESPAPHRFAPGGVAAYGYEGRTLFLARVTPTASGTLKADVKWLVCADACVAGEASLNAAVRVGPRTILGPMASRLRNALGKLPRPATGWALSAARGADGITLTARPPEGERANLAEFFPSEGGLVDHSKPFLATLQGGRFVFKMEPSPFPEPKSRLKGLLVFPGGRRSAVIVRTTLEKGNSK